MEDKEKSKEKPKERYELVEVPTETGVFVRDNESETVLDDKVVLLQILNTVEKIKKAIA